MEWDLLQYSLVVLAADNNPTILNPDFLLSRGIVRESFGMEVATPPITTPPFATVKYNNGISITVEPQKIQITHNEPEDIKRSYATDILAKYVETIPHVLYRAVGINFKLVCKVDTPSSILEDCFLKKQIVESKENRIIEAGIKLVYDYETMKFSLNVNSGTLAKVDKPKESIRGIIVDANFHQDLTSPQSECQGQIESIVGKSSNALQKLQTTLDCLFRSTEKP